MIKANQARTADPPVRPRGRPPSQKARAAILRAARELLSESGLTGVTMEGIAARARVGKPTLYRHWANRFEVAMAALIDAVPDVEPHGRGSPLELLRRQLREVAMLFTTRTGRSVAAVLAATYGETEIGKAFRSHFIETRRNEGRRLLQQAIALHEVRHDIDLEIALDLIYGPLFYRLTFGHTTLDTAFADGVLAAALRGIGRKGAEP